MSPYVHHKANILRSFACPIIHNKFVLRSKECAFSHLNLVYDNGNIERPDVRGIKERLFSSHMQVKVLVLKNSHVLAVHLQDEILNVMP